MLEPLSRMRYALLALAAALAVQSIEEFFPKFLAFVGFCYIIDHIFERFTRGKTHDLLQVVRDQDNEIILIKDLHKGKNIYVKEEQ